MPRDRPAEDRSLIPTSRIDGSILVIRGHKVMLDADLAELYGVETKSLVRAVRRNAERFPADFMFQVSEAEFENLRYQSGTSSSWGGRRYRPYAFTEHGVAMLSSVLRSASAAQVNIEIMRAFVRDRQAILAVLSVVAIAGHGFHKTFARRPLFGENLLQESPARDP